MADTQFSEFEIDKLGFKFSGDEKHALMDCIGSVEEELEVRTVDKSCRGVVVKHRVVPTGNGTVTISAHFPKDVYDSAYGMKLSTVIDGVRAYGYNKQHPEFSLTEHVVNEDGLEKVKAYPRCVVSSGVTRSVENGGDEVAEVEMEVYVMPDDYGNCMYEALASDLTGSMTAATWMESFDPKSVQTAIA